MPEPSVIYRSDAWRGRVLAAWQDVFARLDDWLEVPGEVVVSYDSRQVQRRETANGTVYLKRIWALTDAGIHGSDWFSALKWIGRPSRALACWRISRQLLAAGFRCAEPVLAARRRNCFGYPEDLIVTAAVPWPTLEAVLAAKKADDGRDIVALAARQLREFHKAGFVHGDCILRNICLDGDGRLVYLDNDRTKRPGPLNLFCSWKRNLAQFGYSLRRCRPEQPEWLDVFYREYFAGQPWPSRLVEKQTAAIESRLAARLKRRNPIRPQNP